jgi:hypothetical protein
MAAIQNGMTAPLIRLEMPAKTMGATPPTNASTAAIQNAQACLSSCTDGMFTRGILSGSAANV